MTTVAEYLVQHAIMVELDRTVASVWQTIIHSNDWLWLTEQIVSFDLTYENVLAYLATPTSTSKEEAFRTIIRNRVNRGGILAPGAGLLKQGDFLMTYNDADEIRTLANSYHFDWQLIPMKNTHHAKMTELLISRNLDWLRL